MTVQVWLSSVDDVDLARAPTLLPAEDRARAGRLVSEQRRRRFLVRRRLARAVLAEAGEDAGSSSSSSGGLAVHAFGPGRIGLDVEERRERGRWERIARRFYTADERRAVAGSPQRFLEFWTLKEAYLKALGAGLAGGLDSLECTGLSRTLGDWMESPAHPGWRFRQFQPQPGYVAALAVEGTPERVELRRWAPYAAAPGSRRASS